MAKHLLINLQIYQEIEENIWFFNELVGCMHAYKQVVVSNTFINLLGMRKYKENIRGQLTVLFTSQIFE